MGARGKKSAADLTVVAKVGELPQPPAEMTDEQSEVWREIVSNYSAQHFPSPLLPLLNAYCRHRVSLRRVGQLIAAEEEAEAFSVKNYNMLLGMQERESRCLASLAVRLGFAESTGAAQKKAPKNKKPWQ